MTKAKRGVFIVFEGLDRCGKTTQTARLAARLSKEYGAAVEIVKFPDRTTQTGKIIDQYLQHKLELPDESVHLLFSANRWESAKSILEKLDQGVHLVVDRYAFSGICYSAAKERENMTLRWCMTCDIGLPKPDKVFFLELPVNKTETRQNFGGERYERTEFQEKVRRYFNDLRTIPETRDDLQDIWEIIDASRTIEDISNEIWNKTEVLIRDVHSTNRQIGKLWTPSMKH